MAAIDPRRSCQRISLARYERLVMGIKQVLAAAIDQGGTTLKDFSSNHQPGYFQQSLQVYGRHDQPCVHCGNAIRQVHLGQRNSYFCAHCQR